MPCEERALISQKVQQIGHRSRSEGTLALSRRKCTLSNCKYTTCSMPLARWHLFCSLAAVAGWPSEIIVDAATAAQTIDFIISKSPRLRRSRCGAGRRVTGVLLPVGVRNVAVL